MVLVTFVGPQHTCVERPLEEVLRGVVGRL